MAPGYRGMDAREAFRARWPGDRECLASSRVQVAWPARCGAAAVMMPREQLDDRFELEQPVGTGGMGTVFRARDSISGDTVAVKILADEQSHLAERFAREAKVLAAL